MADQISRTLIIAFGFSLAAILLVFISSYERRYGPAYKPALEPSPQYMEIESRVNGRIPALNFFIDDPNSIDETIRKLDLNDDTGFSHLSEIQPLLRGGN